MNGRLMLRLPDTFRQFLDYEAARTGLKYAEIIRSALTQTRAWADWQKSTVVKNTTTVEKPKRETAGDRKEREKLLRNLDLYVDERGARSIEPVHMQAHTWSSYIDELRHPPEWGRQLSPEQFDAELRAVRERRFTRYAEHGLTPPPMPASLVEFMTPHCPHDEPAGGSCYECDVENGLA